MIEDSRIVDVSLHEIQKPYNYHSHMLHVWNIDQHLPEQNHPVL